MKVARGCLAVSLAVMLAGCGGGGAGTDTSTPTTSTTTVASLPLGDGLYALTPKVGYVMSCQTSWSKTVLHDGPWIQGSLWYPSEKVSVAGSVSWLAAQTLVSVSGTTMTITSNNLPDPSVQTTGIFPIQSTDPAYQYDTNPNAIQAQTIQITLPTDPVVAATPTCVPMGMIGFTTDGVAIYDALDASGHDAVAHEVQDHCGGHPEKTGQYHFHGPSSCMPNETTSGLVGYALDGFGIYGERDLASGQILHTSDLDACHGTTSAVMWHGSLVTMYHYVLTAEYPYTIGCFKGAPVTVDLTAAQKQQINSFP